MGKLLALIEKFKNLDATRVATSSIELTKDQMLAANREQMLAGKNRLGEDLGSYLDDPYFKSRESAQRYSDWKDQITPHPTRKKGVPNLFITGPYHRSLDFAIQGQTLVPLSNFPAALKIQEKFDDIRGLGGTFKLIYLKEHVRPTMMKEIRKTVRL